MHKQKGLTLLDAIVSVLVLSISLVGIAVMQTSAIKYNQAAQLSAIAMTQIGNMIDRMRANSTGVQSGDYDNITGIPNDNPSCTSVCSSSQIATKDAHYWNTLNAVLLPNGQGTVLKNGSQYQITVRWDSAYPNKSDARCAVNSQENSSCITVEVKL